MTRNKFNLILFITILLVVYSCVKKREIGYDNKNGDKWIREYFPKSKMIKVEGKYRNDTFPVGIERAYTRNGLLFYEVRFNESGKKQGIFRMYYDKYPDGNYSNEEGQYFNDKPIGWWRFYSPNGVLRLMMELDSNSMVKYYIRFDSNGRFLHDSIGEFNCDTTCLH